MIVYGSNEALGVRPGTGVCYWTPPGHIAFAYDRQTPEIQRDIMRAGHMVVSGSLSFSNALDRDYDRRPRINLLEDVVDPLLNEYALNCLSSGLAVSSSIQLSASQLVDGIKSIEGSGKMLAEMIPSISDRILNRVIGVSQGYYELSLLADGPDRERIFADGVRDYGSAVLGAYKAQIEASFSEGRWR